MQPLRHVLRRLARSPLFTVLTILMLALGVGSNTAIFSLINGIVLKPLPYPQPEQLVSVWQKSNMANMGELEASPSDYFTFREESRAFQEVGVWSGQGFDVTAQPVPERVQGVLVTQGTLEALGIQPAMGRWFGGKEDSPDGARTVILTDGYWQRRYGGDRAVLGRTIRVDGEPREIIGVMPRSFRFLDEKPDLILPYRFDRAKTTLGNFSYQVIARLKPGVTLSQANADVGRLLPIVNAKFPPPPGFSVKLFEEAHLQPDVRPLQQDVVGSLGRVLWLLMGSIGVVLLIACANVANLLLVRAEGRQQELAIRSALGAGWSRIAAELMTESVFLSVVGGAAGLGLAWWALRLLVAMAPPYLPRLPDIVIDPQVLLFTLAISTVAGLLFGAVPVLRYARPQVTSALRAGGRTLSPGREAHRARNALVVLQTALAVVLLIGSGLMIRTFQALRRVDPGFHGANQLQTVRIFVPEAQVKEPERVIRMFQEVERKLAAIPSVSAVAFANSVPMDGNNSTDLLYAEDHMYREGQLPPLRRFKFVAPGFFQTMGTPLVAGRDFNWNDLYDQRKVAMVSENMAREMWHSPGAALGKRIREGMKDPWREVVGVVADVHSNGADQKPPTTVYWPLLMDNFWGNSPFVDRAVAFVMRSPRAGSESLLSQVRQAVWSVNAEAPLARIRTVEEIYRGSMARSSFTLVMLAIAGGMALLLGLIGIYAVISYSVSQRTKELGIRMALGAQQASLRGMVVRRGLLLAAIGVGFGLAAAAPLTRIMESMLFGISPLDPLTYAGVSAGLLAAAAAASYAPAWRASAINPVEALRGE
jgi:putative ABC transport system permease protein